MDHDNAQLDAGELSEDEGAGLMPASSGGYGAPPPPGPSGSFISNSIPLNTGTPAAPIPGEQIATLRHDLAVMRTQIQQLESRIKTATADAVANVLDSSEMQDALKALRDDASVFLGLLSGGRDKKFSLYSELPFDAKTGVDKPFIKPSYEKKGANWICLSYPRVAQQVLLHDASGAVNGTTVHLWYVVRVVLKSGDFLRLWICDKTTDAAGNVSNTFAKLDMLKDGSAATGAAAGPAGGSS